MSTSMDPRTDEVLLELGMCFKFRKTSVLTKEQEISCTWVLHYSNSSSVCVGSDKAVAIILDNPSNIALVKQRIILITVDGRCWTLEMEEKTLGVVFIQFHLLICL